MDLQAARPAYQLVFDVSTESPVLRLLDRNGKPLDPAAEWTFPKRPARPPRHLDELLDLISNVLGRPMKKRPNDRRPRLLGERDFSTLLVLARCPSLPANSRELARIALESPGWKAVKDPKTCADIIGHVLSHSQIVTSTGKRGDSSNRYTFKIPCSFLPDSAAADAWLVRDRQPATAAEAEPSLVQRLSERPEAWALTNHSRAEIRLATVSTSHARAIDQALRRHYPDAVAGATRVDRVDEDSASINFRVSSSMRPVLFRLNKRVTTCEALTAVHAIASFLSEDTAFLRDSPVREALVPLKPERPCPRGCGPVAGVITDIEPLLSAYPFVDNAEHYSGRSDAQLSSVATEFGRLQVALLHLPGHIDLTSLIAIRTDLDYSRPLDEWHRSVVTQFAECRPNRGRGGIALRLFSDAADLIAEAVERAGHASAQDGPAVASYVDFHPHNTLLRDDQCVLLYDFESVLPRPRQDESLAFAVHRFVREWVIRQPPPAHPSRSLVRRGVQLFLQGYAAGGSTIPDDFTVRLSTLLRWLYLRKLFSVSELLLVHRIDETGRDDMTLWQEMRKFIGYLHEAAFYE